MKENRILELSKVLNESSFEQDKKKSKKIISDGVKALRTMIYDLQDPHSGSEAGKAGVAVKNLMNAELGGKYTTSANKAEAKLEKAISALEDLYSVMKGFK